MSYDEDPKESNMIKCAFCDWKTPRWTTTSKGKRRNGTTLLLNHVEMFHFDEYMKITGAQNESRTA